MYYKDERLNLLAFDLKCLRKTFSLFSIGCLATILLVSSFSSISIIQQVVAQSSEDDEIEDEESEGLENFVANGDIDSIIYTVSGKWDAKGRWALSVSDGRVTSFDTDMTWKNATAGHSHELRNFQAQDDSTGLSADQSLSFEGDIDVGTNRATSWSEIPVRIDMEKGKIITITVDDEDTDHHFGGQSIHGTVSVVKPCNTQPGADMQIPTDCT
jgi:hypothetical protein